MIVSRYKKGCYVNCRILLHPEIWVVKRFDDNDYIHYFTKPDDFVPIPIQNPVLLEDIGFKSIGENKWEYYPLLLDLNTFELSATEGRKIKTKIQIHCLHQLQIVLSMFYEASLLSVIDISDETWEKLGYITKLDYLRNEQNSSTEV